MVSASPEILVRWEHTAEGKKVTIRPLAGTRRVAPRPELDKATEAELVADPKGACRARDADRPGAQRRGRIAKPAA